ncbi:MAG TPA: O-antigen ligase family protein [Vicinamibacterales bacterium]|nr:O-antigen ligase family protein [Vicinamibacterales bacterium]
MTVSSAALAFRRPGRLAAERTALEATGAQELAFRLYLLFVVSWFLHLPERFPLLGTFRFDFLLFWTIAALALISHFQGAPRVDSRINRLMGLLVAYSILTLPFVEWPGSVLRANLIRLVKALLYYHFTVSLATNERKLFQLVFVFVGCQVFRVLEPLYLHVTQGYWGSAASMAGWETLDRLSGAPHDVVNPNGLAFVILTALCFTHYLWPRRVLGGLAYLAVLPALLYALVLTGSRMGMLALVAAFAVIWMQSRRKVLLLAFAALAVAIAVPRMTPDQRDRYASIFSSETKNAGTARGRIEGIKKDFVVAMRRPIFGHGLGTSYEANSNFAGGQHLSHNLAAEVMQELGVIGLAIFAALIATIAAGVRRAARALRASATASPSLVRLGRALQVWLAINLTCSLFTYGLSDYKWYLLAGLADVLTRLAGVHTAPAPATAAVALAGSRAAPVSRLPGSRPPAARGAPLT